jgi:hypothetical protein
MLRIYLKHLNWDFCSEVYLNDFLGDFLHQIIKYILINDIQWISKEIHMP